MQDIAILVKKEESYVFLVEFNNISENEVQQYILCERLIHDDIVYNNDFFIKDIDRNRINIFISSGEKNSRIR